MRVSLSIAACLFALAAGVVAGPEGSAVDSPLLRVGLIDMNHLFQHSRKFAALTESLQQQALPESDARMQMLADRIRQLRLELTAGNQTAGSPESGRLETQLKTAQQEWETARRALQGELFRKEADIYRTVTLEIEDAVRRYARYHGYTVVLRFTREEMAEAAHPREILSGIQREIVYFQNQDDLTEPILEFLNQEWSAESGIRTSAGRKPNERSGERPVR